jgi:hypothetical protein
MVAGGLQGAGRDLEKWLVHTFEHIGPFCQLVQFGKRMNFLKVDFFDYKREYYPRNLNFNNKKNRNTISLSKPKTREDGEGKVKMIIKIL